MYRLCPSDELPIHYIGYICYVGHRILIVYLSSSTIQQITYLTTYFCKDTKLINVSIHL